jgi:RNA polymerase sigma factor (sigma-70 family)
MAGGSSVELLRDIQILFESGTASGLTDRQLLERFIHHRDAAAFEVLVLRHGPMVLRVCRNLLHDPNDAQDAFQATFLILVRRSSSIRRLDSVGSWLYGVACRAAARVRVGAARRHAVEERAASRVVEAVEPDEADDIDRGELGPIVQEEVRRLPEKYRAAVVLCYWEGQTQEQAAAQLGCPLGTVRSRLARARDLLRRRLTRRGLAPMAFGMESIRKLPPLAPELVRSTVQAAVRVAAGGATNPVVSAAVASLVQGMLWRTTMIKLGGMAAGVIAVGLAGLGAELAAQRSGDGGATRRASEERKPAVDPGGSGGTQPAQAEPAQGVARPKGEPEASPPQIVYANIDGDTTIVKLVPAGAQVKKGDVVCELNSALLREQLANQRIAVKTAEAAYLNAKLDREVAEIAVRAYVEGDYVDQFGDVQGNIKLAEAELALAEEELKLAKASPMQQSYYVKRAELSHLRARFSLEKAQSRKRLLVQYTRDKKIKALEASVKKAHSDELVKQSTGELMRSKEAYLEKQIANCTIVAPADGRVRYIYSQGVQVGEGSTVSPRARLFVIEPPDQAAPPRDPAPATGGGPLR